MKKMISAELDKRIGGLLRRLGVTDEKLKVLDRMYLDVATDGVSISYITADRLERFNGDFWNRELRAKHAFKTRATRVINVLNGGVNLSSNDIGYIKERMGEGEGLEVRIIKGVDIANYYNTDFYAEINGDLGNSCMNNKPKSYFQFYIDELELVVLIKPETGKIYARALMYRDVSSSVGMEDIPVLISRIYSCSNQVYKHIVESWALDNGYYITNGGFGASTIYNKDNEIPIYEYCPYYATKTTTPFNFNNVAYIDTFGDCALHSEYPESTAYMFFDDDDCYKFMEEDGDYFYRDYRCTGGGESRTDNPCTGCHLPSSCCDDCSVNN